jgi:hypothetical protein
MGKKDRLSNLFSKIINENLRNIIADVIQLEKQHRMSSRDNFPKQEIRDIIDREARLIEREGKDEI